MKSGHQKNLKPPLSSSKFLIFSFKTRIHPFTISSENLKPLLSSEKNLDIKVGENPYIISFQTRGISLYHRIEFQFEFFSFLCSAYFLHVSVSLFNSGFNLGFNLGFNNVEFFSAVSVISGNTYKVWQHRNIEINTNDEFEIISKECIINFIKSLGKNSNYILLIFINSDQGKFMAPRNRIENVNYLTNPDNLYEKVNFEIITLMEYYQISEIYHVVFRYREYNNYVPIKIESPQIKKSYLPVSKKEGFIFTDFYAPFSFSERNFGVLVDTNENVKTFLYCNRFLINREFSPIGDVERYVTKIFNKDTKNELFSFIDERTKDGFKRVISF